MKNLCDSCKTDCSKLLATTTNLYQKSKTLNILEEDGNKDIEVIVEECSLYQKK